MIYFTNLIQFFSYTFKIPPTLVLAFIILTIFSILALCFVITTILLDLTYRPEIPQYPYNIFLDRIFPIVALALPTILILSLDLKKNTQWIEKFGYIILLHCFVIAPLFYFWSKHRHWGTQTNIVTWSNPILYYSISIALIYISIWGFYLTFLRFLRLGSQTIITFSEYGMEFIYLAVFLSPHLLLWVLFIIKILLHIRLYLWNHIEILLYSNHIRLLKYTSYFNFAENLYKLFFIMYNFISLSAPLNSYFPRESFPRYRRIIDKLYIYPFIKTLVVFLSILLEILLTHQIYYGLYTLFIYPIFISVTSLITSYNNSFFIRDVCFSDFLQLKTKNIRYPQQFWFLIAYPTNNFGFNIEIPSDILNIWQKEYIIAQTAYFKYLTDYPTQLLLRVSGLTFNKKESKFIKAINYTKQAYCKRLKSAYLKQNGVRWFHTSARLFSPHKASLLQTVEKLHPIVAHCCQNTLDYLALLDTNIPIHQILKSADKVNSFYSIPQFFIHNPKILVPTEVKTLSEVLETSQAYMFDSLTKKGVFTGTIKTMRKAFPSEQFPSMQQNPDIGSNFANSSFVFQNSVGIDYKNIMGKTIFSNRNQVSVGALLQYLVELQNYETLLNKKHPNIFMLVQPILLNLKKAAQSSNWNEQLDIWANNIHLFPSRFLPPLYLSTNFCSKGFHPKINNQIAQNKQRLRALSKKAYAENIPEDHFNDSDVQRMLATSEEELVSFELLYDSCIEVD